MHGFVWIFKCANCANPVPYAFVGNAGKGADLNEDVSSRMISCPHCDSAALYAVKEAIQFEYEY